MSPFGAPIALEDHAFRACLSALGIRWESARLATDVNQCNDIDLRLREGLNSDQVNAGEIGSGALSYSGWNRWPRPVEHQADLGRNWSTSKQRSTVTAQRLPGLPEQDRRVAGRPKIAPDARRRRLTGIGQHGAR
jgi:hypothetical protein